MNDKALSDDKDLTARIAALEANEAVIERYVAAYEWDAGEDGYHDPSDEERVLIADAIAGLISDDEFVRTFNAWQALCQPSAGGPVNWVPYTDAEKALQAGIDWDKCPAGTFTAVLGILRAYAQPPETAPSAREEVKR